MRITIKNKTEISAKYLRLIKWKIYSIKKQFQHLTYVDILIESDGESRVIYAVNIRLGIDGKGIILKRQSDNLKHLFQKTIQAVNRYLSKNSQ